MDSDPEVIILMIMAVLVLVSLNGFFVAAEFAMVKVKSSRIDALALEGNNMRARFASRMLNNLNAYLSACQLGITLASLALGWIGEPAIAKLIEPILSGFLPDFAIHTIAFIIAFSIIIFFHSTLGQQVPKSYAIREAEKVTLIAAIPMVIFYKIMYPFIWLLNGSSNWMLRRSGVEPDTEHESVHTEEEILVLMQESHKGGYIDNSEMAMLDNIFDFSETNAREIMIPRTEMVCLYADLSFEENKQIAIEEMHTRYPVCSPDKDNIIGFVHIKDILKRWNGLDNLAEIIRPITTVPESMSINSLLKLMQKRRTEMALLIDEYGGSSGLVTMEDIIEQIVGEIHDEFDDTAPNIEKLDDLSHSVNGLLLIEEFNEYFGTEIETDDFDTIGGWVYSQIEMPPRREQVVSYNDMDFIIEEVDHMRISRLIIRKSLIDEEDSMLESVS